MSDVRHAWYSWAYAPSSFSLAPRDPRLITPKRPPAFGSPEVGVEIHVASCDRSREDARRTRGPDGDGAIGEKLPSDMDSKVDWQGEVVGVQPRVRLTRSFDQRSHSYLGYVLRVRGAFAGETRDFVVALGTCPSRECRSQKR